MEITATNLSQSPKEQLVKLRCGKKYSLLSFHISHPESFLDLKYNFLYTMTTVTLSRLNLCSNIDASTPLVVMQELAHCHSIPYDARPNSFVFELISKPIGIVHTPIADYEWPIVARYVNPAQDWPIPALQEAYDFLRSWENQTDRLPHKDFSWGPQTPTDPHRLNACVLYGICRRHGVETDREMTFYQLAMVCKMLVREPSYARGVISTVLAQLPKNGLIDLYLTSRGIVEEFDSDSSSDESDPSDDSDEMEDDVFEDLQDSIKCLNNKTILRSRVAPITNSDAIVLAGLNYNLDISLAQNPKKEYKLLNRDPSAYIPADSNVREIFETNAILLDLTETFNPRLPLEIYDENNLIRMARTEGYTNRDLQQDSAYTLLQTAYMSNTFYHGHQPGTKNDRTPFLYEEIDELPSSLIVCYGVKAIPFMTAFRYLELAKLFREQRNFNNPLEEEEVFPKIAIEKLKNLCRINRTADSDEVITERRLLYDAIIATELFTDQTQEKALHLFQLHESTPEMREPLENALRSLFHLSMFMRGWDGVGPYPIIRAPVDNQNVVDLNVTTAIREFEGFCSSLGEHATLITELPLLRYRGGLFQAISNEDGTVSTISERIEIVKHGDEHDNYDSCIRLSSNLLAVSSYKYMSLLGLEAPFIVDRLRDIS